MSSRMTSERLFFRGAGIGLLLLFVAMFLVKQLINRSTNLLLESYLSEVPVALPPVAGPLPSLADLMREVLSFSAGERSELRLDAAELDALAQAHPAYRERVRIQSIEPQGIKALVSLRIFGEDQARRYIAGQALLRVQFFAGALDVFVDDLLVRGSSVHATLKAVVAGSNLADDLYRSGEINLKDLLLSLDSIVLENGEVIVRRRS